MTNKKINHTIMKKENILSVLRVIQENGPINRGNVKELTGLSWGSVSSIVNALLEQNVIKGTKVSEMIKGRNPLILEINTNNKIVIGIDLNIAGITISAMDLNCHILFSLYEELSDLNRDLIINQLYDLLDSVITRVGSNKALIGIGVALQGVVDFNKGLSKFSPYFKQWENVPLKDMLERKYHCAVFIDNSPNYMMLYERWLGVAKNVTNMAFIRLGMTIGMSILADNEIIRGFEGNACEFGHITVLNDGDLCNCGNRGCLETVSSSRALIKRAKEKVKQGEKTILTDLIYPSSIDSINMDILYRGYVLNDELCRQIFDEMALYLGISISNVINLLNLELIVIGGDMTQYESTFMPETLKVVEQRTWKYSTKRVIVSRSKENTASIGAGLVVIENAYSGKINNFFVI